MKSNSIRKEELDKALGVTLEETLKKMELNLTQVAELEKALEEQKQRVLSEAKDKEKHVMKLIEDILVTELNMFSPKDIRQATQVMFRILKGTNYMRMEDVMDFRNAANYLFILKGINYYKYFPIEIQRKNQKALSISVRDKIIRNRVRRRIHPSEDTA